MAELLDDLSGFEFEDLMEDVFRNLGYEDVRQSTKTGDEGRDIVMEEVVDGTRRAVVVECKHTERVGRPVVQKLHSAVATHSFDGPKRGMVVTTGTFTGPAREYAEQLRSNDDPHRIELLDGTDLRAIGDEIGFDLYNGRIEILCDETLRPSDPSAGVHAPVRDAFRDVENIDARDIPAPVATADFRPVLEITAETDATFETSVGVVHRERGQDRILVEAERGHPSEADPTVRRLVTNNLNQRVTLDEDSLGEAFDDIEIHRFGQTETEHKDWAVERIRENRTTSVEYTGDNNVTYDETCEPSLSDVSVQSIDPVYLPRIRQVVTLQQYSYPYEYYNAGPSRETLENGVHRCVHCDAASAETYTYCANCGSINCGSHTKTERLEGTPICTGCAVTERFVFSTKYFYDRENLDTFRTEYESMPVHEQLMENRPLTAGLLLGVLGLAFFLLASTGLL
ncbi:restriction endonuclease [Halorientalis pallida]|uniref:Restriction endonuclease n=1 Tax=Halorientalis pallida TaxID=2479928 RepID=A0A498KWT1_9EURY|nr:restriction endonuclease [Halorientalis pallida]RXK49386.1 restriction endonuclease [Halorientalis pallida]